PDRCNLDPAVAVELSSLVRPRKVSVQYGFRLESALSQHNQIDPEITDKTSAQIRGKRGIEILERTGAGKKDRIGAAPAVLRRQGHDTTKLRRDPTIEVPHHPIERRFGGLVTQ